MRIQSRLMCSMRAIPATGSRNGFQKVSAAPVAHIHSTKIIGSNEHHSHLWGLLRGFPILQPVQEVVCLISCKVTCFLS